MFKIVIFNGNELILEHSQNDYGKVLRFGVNALVELMNQNAQDFRMVMTDKYGTTYFSCVGPKTDIVGIKKVVV